MIEDAILAGIIYDEDYSRKVLPHLKESYFRDEGHRLTLKLITNYINKYNSRPSREALALDLTSMKGLSQQDFEATRDTLARLEKPEVEQQWLVDNSEKFCQDKALYNAIMESVNIADGESEGAARGQIPKILEEALAVSFETQIGHDYMEDVEERFHFYHNKGDKIPFSMESFNDITRGGFERKTINIFLGGTNVGKSLVMCSLAADYLMKGYNVLYITLEMAEKKIAQRIDANLLDIAMGDMLDIPKDTFMKKVERLKSRQPGRLQIKEFPTSCAHVGHFRHVLNELRTKKNFVPDVVIIDYLNICASSRVKAGSNANSYTIVKSITEELRGLFVEHNVIGITATQTNREGYDDSDVSVTSTSESFGVPMTADWMGAIVSNEQLAQLNQYLVIQLKSRYDDIQRLRKFMIGVDRAKMRIYHVKPDLYDGGDGNKGGGGPRNSPNKPKGDPPLNRHGAGEVTRKSTAEFDFS